MNTRFDDIPLTMPVSDQQLIDWQIEQDRAKPAEVWSVEELMRRPIR